MTPSGTVLGPDVRVGDLIEFLGKWHLVERLEPLEGYGIGAQKAFEDSTGWWVSLFPSTPWRVRRSGPDDLTLGLSA